MLGRVEERVCQLRTTLQEYSTVESVISRAVAAFEKDFWQSNGNAEKHGGQNGTSSLDDCVDAVAALDEQFVVGCEPAKRAVLQLPAPCRTKLMAL